MALLTLQSVFARLILFVSNWILGGLLSQDAFGISAMTTTVVSAAFTLVAFGLDDVILQRGRSMPMWEATTMRLSTIISWAAAAVLAVLAPVMAWLYGEPGVIGPILVIACALPAAGLSVVTGARLSSRMDFVFITQWGVVDLFIIQGLTILFAILGCGAYSFALPLPIAYIARAIAFRLRAPPLDNQRRRRAPSRALLRRAGMAAGSKLINGFISQGDYFVLGVLASTTTVGYYFFALRLAAAPVRTIAQTLTAVLFPTMAAMQANPEKLAASAMRAVRLLTWIVTPFCFYQMTLADPVLKLLFGEKWALSIPIIQLLSIGMSMEAVMAAARAYFSAAGKFALSLRLSLLNGFGFFSACVIGTLLGSAVGCALAISIYYLSTQPLVFSLLVDKSQRRLRNYFELFVLPMIGSGVAFGLAWWLSQAYAAADAELYRIAIITVVGWPAALGLFALAAPSVFGEFIDLIAKMLGLGRKPASA